MIDSDYRVSLLAEIGTELCGPSGLMIVTPFCESSFNPYTAAWKRRENILNRKRTLKSLWLKPLMFIGWLIVLLVAEFGMLWLTAKAGGGLLVIVGAYNMAAILYIALALLAVIWDYSPTVKHRGKKY